MVTAAPLRFRVDRAAYFHSQTKVAALAMGGAMGVLWLLDDPNVWVGAVAGLAAIAFRGWFLASEELPVVWEVRGSRLIGPGGREVRLDEISKFRTMGSFVQVVTVTGEKHLIKYQADPAATIAALRRAQSVCGSDTPAPRRT